MFTKVAEDSLIDISGQTWNRMIALLETIESKNKQSPPNPPINREVRVQNCVGRNIAPFEIVKIGDPLSMPGMHDQDLAYQFQHVFKGESTDGETDMFAVCQVGIPADVGNGTKGIGRAIVQGVSTALVDVTNAAHKYARPSGTDGQLESTGETTGVRILFNQSTGLQKCKVLLGATGGGDHFRVKMTWTGGSNGSTTAMNSYIYRVDDLNDTEIESGVTVPFSESGGQHDYKTWERGEVLPATAGEAYFGSDGSIVIHDCNEKLRLGECVDSGGGDPKKCKDPLGPGMKKKCIPPLLVDGSTQSYYTMFSEDGKKFIISSRLPVEREMIKVCIEVDGAPDYSGFVRSSGDTIFVKRGTNVIVSVETHSITGAVRNQATFGLGTPLLARSGCCGGCSE